MKKNIVNCSDHCLCCSSDASLWSTGLLLDVSVHPVSRFFNLSQAAFFSEKCAICTEFEI